MIPKSVPFQIEDSDSLVGIDRMRFLDFFKQCFTYCKKGKIYQFQIKEVTASEVHQNYYRASLSLAADTMGITPTALERNLQAHILEMASDDTNEFFSKEDWVIEFPDIRDGAIKQELQRFSQWDASMLNSFLDYMLLVTVSMFPEFRPLDSKDYKFEVKGRKRQLPFPDLKMVIKF